MKTTKDINKYAQAGAIDNEHGLTVEYFGKTVFHYDKDMGRVHFYAPEGMKTTYNQINHVNTALEIAGWNHVELERRTPGKEAHELALVDKETGHQIGWINLDDADDLQWSCTDTFIENVKKDD